MPSSNGNSRNNSPTKTDPKKRPKGPSSPSPPLPTSSRRNVFCTIPFELHFMIGDCLLTEKIVLDGYNALTMLRKTCKLFYNIYTHQQYLALSNVLESKYRRIDRFIWKVSKEISLIARRVLNNGFDCLSGFVAAWKSIPRNGYWKFEEQLYLENMNDSDYMARRDRLITNWLWVEFLTGLLMMFDEGKYSNEVCKGARNNRKQVNRTQVRTGYTGSLDEKERLKMLHFLMTEFVPSLGDGVYESAAESDGQSDWTCEACSNYRPPFDRDSWPEYYGRYGKYDTRRDETGPLLAKNEVWFREVCSLMLKSQHVGCMRVLVQHGGLEWRLFSKPVFESASTKQQSFLDAAKKTRRNNPKFIQYLEGEKRIADLTKNIERSLDTLSERPSRNSRLRSSI